MMLFFVFFWLKCSTLDHQVDILPHQPGLYWTIYSPALINESTTQHHQPIVYMFYDYNHFSVTLMKNHYTFMRIKHHICPIHLLTNHYLFLLPMPVAGLVSN